MSNFAEEAATKPRTVAGVAIALGTLLTYLAARGMIGFADRFCRALFGTVDTGVSWIPWLGHKAAKGLDKVKARLINYLGDVAVRLDHGISTSFHGLAQVFEDLGNEIAWQGAALAALAWYLTKKIGAAAIGPKIHTIQRAQTHAKVQARQDHQRTATVAREVAHPQAGRIGAAIKHAVHSVAVDVAGLRSWTIPRVRTLEREVGIAIPHDIAGLRARARALDRRIEGTWGRLRKLEKATVGIGAAALVITALGRLGAGWIRCTNVRNLGRRLCGMDTTLLDSLLLGTTAIFGAISIVTLAEACLKAEEEILPLVMKGFSELKDVPIP